MNTHLSIKNFRAFDNKGVSIDLRPMTILTGCNSSGKSSIAKALILLNNFLESANSETVSKTPRLDFGKAPLSIMGNFEMVLNKKAVSAGDKVMTISYDIAHMPAGDNLTVTLVFGLDEKDLKKNGFIQYVSISDSKGHVLMADKSANVILNYLNPERVRNNLLQLSFGNRGTNLSAFKTYFFSFALAVRALSLANSAYTDYAISGDTTEEEYREVFKKVTSYLLEVSRDYDRDTVLSTIEHYSNNIGKGIRDMLKADPELLEVSAKKGILTFLPILEKLDTFPKEEFEKEFRDICAERIGKTKVNDSNLNEIISGFMSSDKNVFSDYYRELENEFLDDRFSGKSISDEDDLILVPLNSDSVPIRSSEKFAFEKAFRLLCDLDKDAKGVEISSDAFIPETYYSHDCLGDFSRYRNYLIRTSFSTDICQSLTYVGSSRIEVKRLYSADAQDNFSLALSEYLEAMRVLSKYRKYAPGSFINKWIKEFGIGDRFEVLPVEDGLGYVLKIFQSAEDKKGKLLADYGFGISQLISILIEIETAILKAKKEHHVKAVDFASGKVNIGKIFSPAEEELLPRTITIEEPEIHQHPSYQSKMAEMFVDAMNNYNIHFILETHSEYLVRKLQNLIAKKVALANQVAILYVNDESRPEGEKKIRQIQVAEDGRLTEPFGPGFFDEADALAMNLLMIKGGLV